MICLCIKLLSTGSAMMWEGGGEGDNRREREREEGGEKKDRGREGGCKWQFSVTPSEGGREGGR